MVPVCGPTMFKRIHVRTGSAIFYPRNTPSMIVNNIPSSKVVQWVTAHRPFFTGSYADRRKPPPSDSGQPCTSAKGRDLPVASEAICPIKSKFPHFTSLAALG
jgi:hypothetical protein